jgi:TetR/AcrR family transcriptional repressor of bet genes
MSRAGGGAGYGRSVARPSNTQVRRAEIVSAMMRVMARRGYALATTAEVAREAGLRQGLIHYHFETKEEILLEVGRRMEALLEARFGVRAALATTPRARLEAFLQAHLDTGEDADLTAVRCWVAMGAEALHGGDVALLYAGIVQRRRETLQALVAAALGNETQRAADVVTALLACVQGLFELGLTVPDVLVSGSASRVATMTARALLP